MKLGVISDIHLDINEQYPIIELLKEEIERRELEGIVLAGDIANGPEKTIPYLEKMRSCFSVPLWFVPGNHDMWDVNKTFENSWKIYYAYENEEGCLCNHPVTIGSSVLIGNIGWYDYSFGETKYTFSDFKKKTYHDRMWQDSIYMHWEEEDQDLAENLRTELKHFITANQGKRIVSVTHMIGIPELKVPLSRKDWDYFNAFLGSKKLGEMYEKEGVSTAIMGHVHYRTRLQKNNVDYVCACLNYHTEWETKNPQKEISQALQEIIL